MGRRRRAYGADFVDDDGQFLMSLQTFVIEAGGLRIIVDTGVGNSKDRPLIPEFDHQIRFSSRTLAAAGFPPETIDFVVCTHLHADHVGWNTRLVDGEWIPTFPARATCLAPASTVRTGGDPLAGWAGAGADVTIWPQNSLVALDYEHVLFGRAADFSESELPSG